MVSEYFDLHISSEEEEFIEPNEEESGGRRSETEGDPSQEEQWTKLAVEVTQMVGDVHAAYLFHPKASLPLSLLCACISSLPSRHISSWRHLADHFQLSFHQIGCIENYNHADSTELVLKTFAQKKDAKLSDIVSALGKMQRFDALHVCLQHFPVLIQLANEDHHSKLCQDHLEQLSHCEDRMERQPRIPKKFQHILQGMKLPITLQLISNEDKIDQCMDSICNPKDTRVIPTCKESVQQSQIHSQKKVEGKVVCHERRGPARKVMLTFSEDGELLARSIARSLTHPSSASTLPIGVLILDQHLDKLLPNPERFIIHQFAKMDYVVPIVTGGYLDALGSRSRGWSGGCAVDCQYVTLIHDLMVKDYVQSGCRNRKVRCIVPSDQLDVVLAHPHHRIDPVLSIYLTQDRVDQLASRILSSRRPALLKP